MRLIACAMTLFVVLACSEKREDLRDARALAEAAQRFEECVRNDPCDKCLNCINVETKWDHWSWRCDDLRALEKAAESSQSFVEDAPAKGCLLEICDWLEARGETGYIVDLTTRKIQP